jgi:tetratricopeptide (TPR) repeat protein
LILLFQLLQTGQQEISDNKRLELLATAARLEALIAKKTDGQWVNKFREVLLKERKIQPKYKVILKRIYAVIATQNKHYNEALKLLHEALTYYKDQVNRRAIAACLEEIAEIEFKQQHYTQELEYLKKALSIRVWLKDQYHIDEIQKKIVKVKSSY